MRNILVTGSSGFIGFHLCRALLEAGNAVTGLDSMNDYYAITLKERRLALLRVHARFTFVQAALEDRPTLCQIVEEGRFDAVVNLAAQAGVRYSLTHPEAYVSSNLVGFFHLLDACRAAQVPHLLYASSSSVYGANTKLPFSTRDRTDHPVSLYAATKKCNEVLAYSYSHMFGLKATGLRFFTVYGPYGRPDMALFKFTKAILAGETITVFNHGDMQRDFTYVDDVVEGIVSLLDHSRVLTTTQTPHHVYNLGNNSPVELMEFIRVLEDCLGKKATIAYAPLQAGDVKATYADTADLLHDCGFAPHTSVHEGIASFVRWYREYYGV